MRSVLFLFCLLLAFTEEVSAATYYIDYVAGSDANNGTAKATPWKHHPDMKGWTGGAFTAQPGDIFIMKGGVTWPNAALSLYITDNGTAANPITITVDETWYDGDQYVTWTDGLGVSRQSFNWPVLDAQGQQIVDSRTFGGGSQGTRNNIIAVSGDYIRIEGIWAKGVLVNDNSAGGDPAPDSGTDHTLRCYTAVDFTAEDCYFSDWVVETQYVGDVGGPYADSSTDTRLINCRIKGPETIDPQWITATGGLYLGHGARAFSLVQGCDISRTGHGLWSCKVVDGNIVHNVGWPIEAGAHPNPLWAQGTQIVRNNVFLDSDGVWYLLPGYSANAGSNQTILCYNNVFIDCHQINLSNQNSDDETNQIWFFNNVAIRDASPIQVGTTKTGAAFGTLVIQNNLFISRSLSDGNTTMVAVIDANDLGSNYTNSNNVYWNVATATANSLTDTNLFEPTVEIAALFDQGADVSTITTTDINGNPRNVGAATDIGASELQTEVTPNPGVIQFEVSSYNVTEGTATVTLKVTRTGGSDGIIGGTWALNDGTATDTDDYTDDGEVVAEMFADGVTTPYEIVVAITNDSDIESEESFTAVLSSPTGGATLGGLSTATITITDNDTAGGVPLMSSLNFEADAGLLENGATATVLTTEDGWVHQTTQTTTPSDGYRARYRFIPTITGDYIVQTSLVANTTSSDSVFFHIYPTASPVAVATPDHIYDVLPLTEGLEQRDVSNRGSGTFDNPEFSPVTYSLTGSTEYTLEIRGREANCFLDSIEIIRVVSGGNPPHRRRGSILVFQ